MKQMIKSDLKYDNYFQENLSTQHPQNSNILENSIIPSKVPKTMQLKCRKMNNITLDDLPQRVGDMHSILLGISLELSNIKKLMKIEKDANEQDEESDSQKSLKEDDGNTITSHPDSSIQGNPSLNIMRNNIYEAETHENKSGNSYDGMKNYQPVFRERESFSSLSGHLPARFQSARTNNASITNKISSHQQSEKRPSPEYHKSVQR